VEYDPTIYLGAARHYCNGRPAYSADLVRVLGNELPLGLSGRLLDVGCGPGVLTLALAEHFSEAIGLDPDPDMLAEGARRADELGVRNVRWVRAVAEAIATLDLGPFRVVTFGQSFHWTDRERVAEAVFDLLEPGGVIALIAPTVEGRPVPANPGYPLIPHDQIKELVARYLGSTRRAGRGFGPAKTDRFEDALARTRFGRPRQVFAPGRPDIVRDVDSIVDGCFSMSSSAPHLFGAGRDRFEAELRALLRSHSPDGLFWDWPGDTEIVVGTKPA
jgi:SAM-dependent methyltransferase